MESQIQELEKKIELLIEKVDKMESDKRKGGRDYAQSKVFTERITFRGDVYDKSGTKVIN
jgi:outer membrane murein-binding lipoprotein Lpp